MKVIVHNPELRTDITLAITIAGTYHDRLAIYIHQDGNPNGCSYSKLDISPEIPSDATSAIDQRLEARDRALSRCHGVYPIIERGKDRVVAIAASLSGAITVMDDLKKNNPGKYYEICRELPLLSDEFIRIEYEPTQFEKDRMKMETDAIEEQMESQFRQSFKDIMTNIEQEYK